MLEVGPSEGAVGAWLSGIDIEVGKGLWWWYTGQCEVIWESRTSAAKRDKQCDERCERCRRAVYEQSMHQSLQR